MLCVRTIRISSTGNKSRHFERIDGSGAAQWRFENCNIHVAKNVARAVANLTGCDLALALARQEACKDSPLPNIASESSSAVFDSHSELLSQGILGNLVGRMSVWHPILSSWAKNTDNKRSDGQKLVHPQSCVTHLTNYKFLSGLTPKQLGNQAAFLVLWQTHQNASLRGRMSQSVATSDYQ